MRDRQNLDSTRKDLTERYEPAKRPVNQAFPEGKKWKSRPSFATIGIEQYRACHSGLQSLTVKFAAGEECND
jgi:hypothetical protein